MTARALGLCAALALSGSCSIGAPPGFSSGDAWSFPLVDPLGDGLLVTPVMIKGKGPYLFAIDPDADESIIDERVAIDAHLRMDRGFGRLWSDDGELRGRFQAQLDEFQVGTLHIGWRRAIVVPHETLAVLGHDVRGVLGRNVIADSLVFGFDRDRGIGWLETVAHFTPRADATRVGFERTRTEVGNGTYGALVRATVANKPLALEVTLGSVVSRIRPKWWDPIGIAAPAGQAIDVDATGAHRAFGVSPTRASVALGGLVNPATVVGAYAIRLELRSDDLFLDGTLALDFFAPFDVAMSWDAHALYLSPRGDAAAQTAMRIGRWDALARCPHAGCVTVSLVEPPMPDAASNAPGAAAPPPFILHVTRDRGADMPLEARLRANRPGIPDLVVELPAGAREVLAPVRGDVHGVQYDVIDASPFAQPCEAPGTGCVR